MGALNAGPLLGPKGRDAVRIVRRDPVTEEASADAEGHLVAVDFDQSERRQPTREGGLAQFGLKTRPDLLPGVLRVSG